MSDPQKPDRRLQRDETSRQQSTGSRETSRAGDSVPVVSGQFNNLPAMFGRYEVKKLLGQGAMGSVYLAVDTQLGRKVALKIPKVSAAGSKRLLQRLETEAKAAAKLDHTSLCKVYDAGAIGDQCFIVMQYIVGETLKSQLEARRKTVEEAVSIIATLADGLSEAHAHGIIHRDLKPENIMINHRGVPVIMDFGLARFSTISTNAAATQAGTILGSPAYMSPEQAGGNTREIDQRSDIYSLGVILYELLTGTLPFSGSVMQILGQKSVLDPVSPLSVNALLPPELAAICHRMIARSSVDRYQNLHDVISDLNGLAIGLSSSSTISLSDLPDEVDSSFDGLQVADPGAYSIDSIANRHSPKRASKINKANSAQPLPQRLWMWWNRLPPVGKWIFAGSLPVMIVLAVVVLFSIPDRVPQIEKNGKRLSVDGTRLRSKGLRGTGQAAPNVRASSSRQADSSNSITNSLGMKLALIPAGEFSMGAPDSDTEAAEHEKPRHRVQITNPFYLGAHEVTKGEFAAFVGDSKYVTEAEREQRGEGTSESGEPVRMAGCSWRSPGYAHTDDHPVVNVTWIDAIAFCEWLGRKEGTRYRLPTEAEWEYACRAKTETTFSSGNDAESLVRIANVADQSAKKKFAQWTTVKGDDGYVFSSPVGRFQPNAFGLFDMHGNVWEWCQDVYDGRAYADSDGSRRDPIVTSGSGLRVARGGSWSYFLKYCRASFRDPAPPNGVRNYLGFRIARDESVVNDSGPGTAQEEIDLLAKAVKDRSKFDKMIRVRSSTVEYFTNGNPFYVNQRLPRPLVAEVSNGVVFAEAFGRKKVICTHPSSPNAPAQISFSSITRQHTGSLTIFAHSYPSTYPPGAEVAVMVDGTQQAQTVVEQSAKRWHSMTVNFDRNDVVVEHRPLGWDHEGLFIDYAITLTTARETGSAAPGSISPQKSDLPTTPPGVKNADGTTNLLALLSSESAVLGRWKIEPNRLRSLHHLEPAAQVVFPIDPPPEYTIHIHGTRLPHVGTGWQTLGVGLVCGKQDCLFAMDTHPPHGTVGLQTVDGLIWNHNETTLASSFTKVNVPFLLQLIVRENNIEARVDGRTILDWQGDFWRLQREPSWKLAEPQRLFLAAASRYTFDRVALGPPLPRQILPGSNLKPGESTELLAHVDLQQDVWSGSWQKAVPSVKTTIPSGNARFSVRYDVPDEYELAADIESDGAARDFYLGVPFQKGHAGINIGGADGQTNAVLLDIPHHNSPTQLPRVDHLAKKRNMVIATVRKNHLVINVNGSEIFNWKGVAQRFAAWPQWATPGNRVTIGANNSTFQIHSLKLTRLAPAADAMATTQKPRNGDLLALVDVQRDTMLGAWSKTARGVESFATRLCNFRFPAQLPADYEFRVVVERKVGRECMVLALPVSGNLVFCGIDGWGGTICGLKDFEDTEWNKNSTTIRRTSQLLVQGTPAVLQGRVRGKHLTFECNGVKLWDLDIPDTLPNVSSAFRPGWLAPEQRVPMAITTWFTQFEVLEARFRTLDNDSPPFPPLNLKGAPKTDK